jgi:hypothetical protein
MKRLFVLIVAAAFSAGGLRLARADDDRRAGGPAEGRQGEEEAGQRRQAEGDGRRVEVQRVRSGAGASTDKTVQKNRPTGSDAMQSQMQMQANKPSKPVDKTLGAARGRMPAR